MTVRIPDTPAPLTLGPIVLDLAGSCVRRGADELFLTPTEQRLLALFLSYAGVTLTHATILATVWGETYVDATATLHTHMQRLRAKIEPDPAQPIYIKTVWRVGYKWCGPLCSVAHTSLVHC